MKQLFFSLALVFCTTTGAAEPRSKMVPSTPANSAGVASKQAPIRTETNLVARSSGPTATPADKIKIAAPFKIELLYSPSKAEGSWVSMCVDDLGRLIACDQYDAGLYRITPGGIGKPGTKTRVQKIRVDLSGAQGLLWAQHALYVLVSKNGKHESGLYRVTDRDGDDQLDTVELLRRLDGGGDHGWHALLAGPDGKSIYVIAGNATKGPPLSGSRVPPIWSEDHLLPRLPDGRGFMVGVLAPGGCIYRVDLAGRNWELISMGFRNPYDAAFSREGELFTYDADMEWDMNTPWYRPTRLCLVTSGSEFGWRNGAGKWPAYYADSLPPVLDVGPGSPTGMAFGYGTKFPKRFQNALFLADWSYGRIYAVHLTPACSSYRAEAELFASGAPLPTTAIRANPADGALYFITGGWRIQTGLYRISYSGPADGPNTAEERAAAAARQLRRQIEAFHGRIDPRAVDFVWPHLGNPDRFIRFAARVALEWQPRSAWENRALAEADPSAALTAALALARSSARDAFHRAPKDSKPEPDLETKIVAALDRIDWRSLSNEHRIELLRVYSVTFTRLGKPCEQDRQKLAGKFDAFFPAENRELNAELCELLVFLEMPTVAAKGMDLVRKAVTQEEQIEYIKSLRVLRNGWTPELRREYFSWFLKAANYRGGASFAGFMRLIKNDAVANLSERERAELRPILEAAPVAQGPLEAMRAMLAGRTVAKEWTVEELASAVESGLKYRDFSQGRKLFAGAGCFACHRFANEGGAVGPDLTSAAGRFSPRDLIEAIVEPSKTVSDLYAPINITKSDGEVVTGRIVYLGGDNVQVNTDMFDPSQAVTIDRKQVTSIQPSAISPMPEGLLSLLQRDEILDLVAYVLSGGDGKNEMFRPLPKKSPAVNRAGF